MPMLKGGGKLKAKLAEIQKKVVKAQAVKVGFLSGSTYPDGTSVPMVAALNEYGTSKMPPRPFFRSMIAAKQSNWGKSLANVLKNNDYDVSKSLALMGEGIGSQLQQSIVDFDAVPLADSTVAQKGFDKQLIDTANMINSVSYQVDDGDKVKLPQIGKGRIKKITGAK